MRRTPGEDAGLAGGAADPVDHLTDAGLDPAALRAARGRARALGVAPDAVLLAAGLLDPVHHAHLVARALRAQGPDAPGAVDPRAGAVACAAAGTAPLLGGGHLLRADGPAALHLLAVGAAAPGAVLRDARGFRDALLAGLGPAIAEAASHALPRRDPALSARDGASLAPLLVVALAVAALLAGLAWAPAEAAALLGLGLAPLFLGVMLVPLAGALETSVLARPAPRARDAALPTYSVLVPLRHEAAVVPKLLAALDGLDYPRERLEVLLLIEADDPGTLAAVRAAVPPPHVGALVVPAGRPRTKPRALNAAMLFARGEFVVVFDAEDEPEPDQLRRAAAAFAAGGPRVACVQARLSIDNTGDGALPALFTVEYCALFDAVKAGHARLGLPVALGGSSNHLRADALRAVGGWDAWNVTEDADLGFRLARRGYLTRDLPSTTLEEAPRGTRAWLAQRARWHKGWVQTALTLGREPRRAWRELGPRGALVAGGTSAGVVLGALLRPLVWLALGLRVASGRGFAEGGPLLAVGDVVGALVLGSGALAALVPALVGLRRRGLLRLAPWLLALPLHGALSSLAAWRGLVDLARDPYGWAKTRHGLARTSRRGAAR